jgi:hypothetical protein
MTDTKHTPQNRDATALTAHSNSHEKPKSQNAQALLNERLKRSEAMKLVAMILAGFPRGAARDEDVYLDTLAAALCQEPSSIAIACANPHSGIVQECMFKPTAKEIHDWCARAAEPLRRIVGEADRRNKLEAPIIDRSNRPSIDELRERYGPTFGIKRVDALDKIRGEPDDEERERRVNAERAATMVERNRRNILADYARLKLDPVKASDGTLVSPALLRALNRMPTARDDMR